MKQITFPFHPSPFVITSRKFHIPKSKLENFYGFLHTHPHFWHLLW